MAFLQLSWSPLEKKVCCFPSYMSVFGSGGSCWEGLWKAAVLGQYLRDGTRVDGKDAPFLMQGEQL